VDYMQRVIELFDGYKRFVEVRHKSWEGKRAKSITFCTIDQSSIGESIEFNISAKGTHSGRSSVAPIAGNDAAYIRFHGRNEEAWKNSLRNFGKKLTYEEQNARYEYLYSQSELLLISRKIKEVYDKVKDIYIVMNNHPKGDAVANAFELLHLLKNRGKIEMPETIIKAYPNLKLL